MQLTIHYEPATPRAVVVLHAWHPAASPWHLESPPELDGTFRFTLEHTVADQREIQFKYFFPREGNRWESDDYIRRVPTRDAAELWTFDFSARCLTRDPYAAPAPDHVIFHAITRRFQGGTLFAWAAAGGQSERFAETSRDLANQFSTFDVPLRPWMRRGFLFKLVTADGQFEAEPYNRLWRPADSGEAWFKSGQIDVRSTPLTPRAVTIELIHGRTLVPVPTLNVADGVDDFRDQVAAATTEDLDAAFCVSSYRATIYPGALYWIRAGTAGAGWNLLERPFRWREDLPAMPSIAVAGSDRWLAARPARTALVRLVVHPNPGSAWPQAVDWNLAVGGAPPHETITAARQADGTWVADFRVFPELTHGLTPSSAGVAEARPDGPFDPRREFEAPAGGPTTLHTADGIAGMARIGGPAFADVPANTRHALLAAAYSPAVADAGVFDTWEMPHGPVVLGDDVWFTLPAPHAVQAQLIVLDPASPAAGPRRVAAYPMRLTPDLRYWWCRVPRAAVPHGAFYRFLLNDDLEVLDPAARWAHDPGRLWCQPGEGRDGPWARFVDPAQARAILAGSPWRTMGWQALVVYELHPRRFTRRNANVSSDFDQVVRELQPGGYLQRLPVRVLEFLPVHEFPSAQSWGYNPSLFFAVDSSYGGPEELARCVRACHDAGRAVLLDIVFNHMTESPLQTIARDTYVSGETNWGDMVHYAHPACREFFRQALVHLWQTYALDGFRFDATEAIVNGHVPNGYILRKTGNGKGWEFLDMLRQALRRAADASGRPWPYLVAENDPNNWGLTDVRPEHPGVLDAQWHFSHHYRLGEAAQNREDKADAIRQEMDWPHRDLRPFYEAVRYAESHDSTSGQEDWKQRIARREAWGFGRRMAKAIGAAVLLAKGVPMLFMGQEAGEDIPFYFGMDDMSDPSRYLRLDVYDSPGEMNRILAWFRDLLGLRNNPDNGLLGDDDQSVRSTPKTVAFTRRGGRFFVVATLGTPYTVQNLGWLGLPGGAAYKEIFNSTWPAYRMENEPESSNGGYDARLSAGENLRMPGIGAVILERA